MTIIDIEIPHNCEECKLLYDSLWCKVTGDNVEINKDGSYADKRLPNCPLKEVEE